MIRNTYSRKKNEMRTKDPYLDRRSGEDRRKVYAIEFFQKGNSDRRLDAERRINIERRRDCVRVDEWSSVCPGPRKKNDY